MSPDRAALERAVERGEREGGSVEFKERLTEDLHATEGRFESLAAQLRHRVLSGDGEATYVVGVTDDGGIAGIPPEQFSESMDVLSLLAEEAGAHIEEVQTWGIGDGDDAEEGIVGVATVREGTAVEDDEHIVVGTAGHVDHGKSTLVGSLVTGQSDDGPTETTREHLGILLATDLPTVVAITKADLVEQERVAEVEREVERLLREVDKTPLRVSRHGVETAIEEISETVVPVVTTSAVTERGLETLDEMFARLPKTAGAGADEQFRMYVDRTYNVTGVGAVASGTIKSGEVAAGDELLLGPMQDGSFREVEVRSIEMHYHRVDRASAGRIVGVALKGVREADVQRGMVLLPREASPDPVREFEAEVMVLNHPTRIGPGYEPVVHIETVSEAAALYPADGQLLPGDSGRVTVRFKFRPYLVEEGQRFVFREGRSKGVGTVVNVD